jgi:hypothetical protein
MTRDEYANGMQDILDRNSETIESTVAQDAFNQSMIMSTTRLGIQARGIRNTEIINEGRTITIGKIKSFSDDPNRIFLLDNELSTAKEFGYYDDTENIREKTIASWATYDAEKGIPHAQEVLKRLGDPKDQTYPLSPEDKNQVFNKVKAIINRQSDEEKVEKQKRGVLALMAVDDVLNSDQTYAEKYWAIDKMRKEGVIKPDEAKTAEGMLDSRHSVDPETSADTLLDLQTRLRSLDTRVANIDYENFFKETRSLIKSTNKAYGDGDLSYRNYRQIVKQIKTATADKSREVVDAKSEWRISWGDYSPDEAYAEFSESTDSKVEADKLFVDYYSITASAEMSNKQKKEKVRELIDNHKEQQESNATNIMNSLKRPVKREGAAPKRTYKVGEIINVPGKGKHKYLGGEKWQEL